MINPPELPINDEAQIEKTKLRNGHPLLFWKWNMQTGW